MTASPASASDPLSVATAYIGLGSNGPDRSAALREAIARLDRPGVKVDAVSPVYETEPIDCAGPLFLNAVARVATTLPARRLFEGLIGTERDMGRNRDGGPGQPRRIDLDLLLYGDVLLSDPDLVIPHPRMASRRFVLEPLSRLAPDLIIPGQSQTVAVLAEKLRRSDTRQKVVLIEESALA